MRPHPSIQTNREIVALSLHQPWATLMAVEAKRVETRSWSTKYRGLVAIHASKSLTRETKELCGAYPFNQYVISPAHLPLQKIIAVGKLISCSKAESYKKYLENTKSKEAASLELAFGDYSYGRWAWEFKDVVQLEKPIEIAGSLGLWELPEDIEEQILGIYRVSSKAA
ncbi:MAG: 2-oxoglutarate dehydrogenase E1 [Blastocatellia bacterium]